MRQVGSYNDNSVIQVGAGTGKTLAFGIPTIERVIAPNDSDWAALANQGDPQVLIVVSDIRIHHDHRLPQSPHQSALVWINCNSITKSACNRFKLCFKYMVCISTFKNTYVKCDPQQQ